MRLAGLDIGTSGCKITVFEESGEILGGVSRDYPVHRTKSAHEIDAVLIWHTVKEILTEAAAKYRDIGGIGIASFGESFVMLDCGGLPVCKSMIYTDPRGEDECSRIKDSAGEENLSRITGLSPHAMYSIPKLMHIKNKLPELYKKTSKICLIGDYISYMLTGNAQIEHSLASRTMAFDINRLDWSGEIMEAAGVDISLFSKPVPFGTPSGEILKGLSAELGLKKSAVIVSCGHDQVAAAVGSGIFESRFAVDGAGSVECITPVFSLGSVNPEILIRGSYSIVPYVDPGKYACYAFSFTGGALLKWFTDNLAGYSGIEAKKRGISVYMQLEGDAPADGPTGILVLPHFSGAATPYMDYGSRGALIGLTLTHTERDIFYALMEGVCYEMRLNADFLRSAGITFESLRATGGGANSRAWMQMKADVLNMPVTALESAEAGAAGCAMAAGAALGLYPNLREAAKIFVREKETYCPVPEMHGRYSLIYEKYKKLYTAVRPLM